MTGTESGGRSAAGLILNLVVRSGWMVDIMPQHLYLREGSWYPLYGRLSATQSQFGQVRRRENLLSPLGFEPWIV